MFHSGFPLSDGAASLLYIATMYVQYEVRSDGYNGSCLTNSGRVLRGDLSIH